MSKLSPDDVARLLRERGVSPSGVRVQYVLGKRWSGHMPIPVEWLIDDLDKAGVEYTVRRTNSGRSYLDVQLLSDVEQLARALE